MKSKTFSLLKDAAATAVYGAEGANGVILITTKRGQIAKARISVRAETKRFSGYAFARVCQFIRIFESL